MKKALITGVTGQDGSYLADLLIAKGYQVHGVKRRASSFNTQRVDHIYQDPHESERTFIMHYGDMTDALSIAQIIKKVKPDEIYNLAAQSHVRVSFELPQYTAESDAIGPLRILEAIRLLGLEDSVKFYQASTSEMFGAASPPQDESTPFIPQSPYGAAKLYAHWITVNYREAYNLFACSGILFNHESPRRGETFVTRKITRAIARIKLGMQETLYLGNLNATRDWGHAQDYVRAMYLMLQQDTPADYVIANGESHSVREFCEIAFKEVGISIDWRGEGLEEEGIDLETGNVVVKIDPQYFRPTEVDALKGDASKAKKELGWEPEISFTDLVSEMVQADMEDAKRELYLQDGGYNTRNHNGE